MTSSICIFESLSFISGGANFNLRLKSLRHSYGLEGGRRNYKPPSCQQILTERPPGPGESHGCPYRHFDVEHNLIPTLQRTGVTDRELLDAVREDVKGKRESLAR